MGQKTISPSGANICEKVPGTDGSGEAGRAESGGWDLGRGQLAPSPPAMGSVWEAL